MKYIGLRVEVMWCNGSLWSLKGAAKMLVFLIGMKLLDWNDGRIGNDEHTTLSYSRVVEQTVVRQRVRQLFDSWSVVSSINKGEVAIGKIRKVKIRMMHVPRP
jgi:hypothetical protein